MVSIFWNLSIFFSISIGFIQESSLKFLMEQVYKILEYLDAYKEEYKLPFVSIILYG